MAIRTAVNRALTAITALPTAAALTDGNLTLLTTATASSSSTLSFTSSINSTYNSYLFKFINIHPSYNGADLKVGFRDGSTAYDATKTTTYFSAYQNEAGNDAGVAYDTGEDLAQSTGFQNICKSIGNGNDENGNGFLHLFDPSSTTFVKHFISNAVSNEASDYALNILTAGYCNVTAAIDGVQFSMNTGTIDSGTIKMYGVGPKQS